MATSRKLLILDLNGTLLVRGSHAKRKMSIQDSLPAQTPRLRAVHGRPYLPSFREYLFHTETKKWLDTMVWSSAQPHSVADMVQHCFGETKKELLAIWARDTLDLSQKAYNQKTQTVKDLAKPWASFPIHSSKTTLLLDDSVLKAQLQPWNHLCIAEYVSQMRAKDLEMLRHSAGSAHSKIPLEMDIISNVHAPPSPTFTEVIGPPNDGSRLGGNPVEGVATYKYDEALLAVIGILDVLKHEPNVGNWIRSGGLYIAQPSKPITGDSAKQEEPRYQENSNTMSLKELDDAISSIGDGITGRATGSVWFERGTLVDVWASRGRKALDELHIEIISGIQV